MDTVTDPMPWVRAVRASHDRLAGIVASLDSAELREQSYAKEWSVADVLSHLGSGAEIFELYVNAGLGGELPGQEDNQRIWDTWNARSPEEQAAQSVAANEALVSRVESLTPDQLAAFRVAMFGGMIMDAAGLLRMRLSEHAVHSCDVEVAVDPAARVSQDAVELLRGQRLEAGDQRLVGGDAPRRLLFRRPGVPRVPDPLVVLLRRRLAA